MKSESSEIAKSDGVEPPNGTNTLVPWKTVLSVSLRLKFILTGIIFPLGCFGFTLFGGTASVDSPWQSGELEDYTVVLLSAPTVFVFLPITLYSILALFLWCLDPWKQSSKRWVQLGLNSGVILTIMVCILLMFPTGILSQIFALFVGIALWATVLVINWMIRKQFSIQHLLIVTLVFALASGLIAAVGVPPGEFFSAVLGSSFFLLLCITAAAPTLAVITFARASIACLDIQQAQSGQHQQKTKSNPIPRFALAWLVWLGTFVATWKVALEVMAIEYTKLPTTNPNCYVSSAAAYGHPKLVGVAVGKGAKINLQMKRLKFLELAIATTLPLAHAFIRRIYNRVGPKLARFCQSNIWFADATFLMLKPVEFLAEGIRRLLGIKAGLVDQIYERDQ